MAAAVDSAWEDDQEDEEEEEEIEEVVSAGQRPAASTVSAEPSPGGEGSPGCGRWEAGRPADSSHALRSTRSRGGLAPGPIHPF